MSKKNIFIMLTILFLPILTFWGITSLQGSSAVANTSGLPQVIKFSSSMCLECKQVEDIFEEIMPKYIKNVEYKKIIVDSRKDMKNPLIKQYKVTLVPTVVMINSDGSTAQKIVGAVSKEQYEQCIKGLK